MFGRRLPLINLLGFEIRFDLTWLILVALIVWTLSVGYFPAAYADLSTATYVWMAILGALGLFASIVLHELAHSVVGRHYGMQIRGITLFAFGGAAELQEEPATPKVEFLMAIAGPLMSVLLAGVFYLLGWLLLALAASPPVVTVLGYLAVINLLLAAFNMLPAFPLDGGRVLRAALWAWRGDLSWATRVASLLGGGLGLGLIFLGILNAFYGYLLAGAWWFLIGLFIRAAASAAHQRQQARRMLEGVPTRRLMNSAPITVPPSLSVAEFVEDYLLGRSLKRLPVVEDGRFLGQIGVAEAKRVPPEERARRSVGEVLTPAGPELRVSPETGAMEALAQMQREGQSRLFAVEGERLVGVLALRDMLQYLSVASELGERPAVPRPSYGGRA